MVSLYTGSMQTNIIQHKASEGSHSNNAAMK